MSTTLQRLGLVTRIMALTGYPIYVGLFLICCTLKSGTFGFDFLPMPMPRVPPGGRNVQNVTTTASGTDRTAEKITTTPTPPSSYLTTGIDRSTTTASVYTTATVTELSDNPNYITQSNDDGSVTISSSKFEGLTQFYRMHSPRRTIQIQLLSITEIGYDNNGEEQIINSTLHSAVIEGTNILRPRGNAENDGDAHFPNSDVPCTRMVFRYLLPGAHRSVPFRKLWVNTNIQVETYIANGTGQITVHGHDLDVIPGLMLIDISLIGHSFCTETSSAYELCEQMIGQALEFSIDVTLADVSLPPGIPQEDVVSEDQTLYLYQGVGFIKIFKQTDVDGIVITPNMHFMPDEDRRKLTLKARFPFHENYAKLSMIMYLEPWSNPLLNDFHYLMMKDDILAQLSDVDRQTDRTTEEPGNGNLTTLLNNQTAGAEEFVNAANHVVSLNLYWVAALVAATVLLLLATC